MFLVVLHVVFISGLYIVHCYLLNGQVFLDIFRYMNKIFSLVLRPSNIQQILPSVSSLKKKKKQTRED